MLLAATSPSPLWYATRGSGVVTLVLLTISVCFGVLATVRWRTGRVPRFVVAGLHRNVTLLAVAFLAVHVVTAVADSFAPIGLRDVFVPFVSAYRPIWLGLGTLACDLLIAVVLTSLLRVRVGYRVWRVTHWLAYASWPLALVHSLGTGSDARFGWMAALSIACIVAVVAAVLVRIARTPGDLLARGVAVAAALAVPVGVLIWYGSGPARHGWAARAGTPASILAANRPAAAAVKASPVTLPRHFDTALTGRLTQLGPDSNGLVTIRIDTVLRGGLAGTLRLALKGYPLDQGGISMTSSGVAFAAKGTPVFQGSVVGLAGNRVSADLTAQGLGALQLVLDLQLDPATGAVSGSVHGLLV